MGNEKLDVVSDAVVCGESVKIKTHFAKIIVEGTAKKPYYDILSANYCPHCGAKMDGGATNAQT